MSRRRSGFTLVELLVVIAIISMLMALLLPAVQRARESARRATCFNNQHQISLALIHYENAHGHYPGYSYYPLGRVSDPNDSGFEGPIGWVLPILPDLERNDIYQQYGPSASNYEDQPGPNAFETLSELQIAILICPSNPPEESGNNLAYVVNSGCPDSSDSGERDYAANGVFHYMGANARQSKVSASYISSHDGVASTLMLSENVNAGNFAAARSPQDGELDGMDKERFMCFTWTPEIDNAAARPKKLEDDPDNIAFQINTLVDADSEGNPIRVANKYCFARPSSRHSGGVVASFCDGHQKFLAEDISYIVFVQLMSPWGMNIADPVNLDNEGVTREGLDVARSYILNDSEY